MGRDWLSRALGTVTGIDPAFDTTRRAGPGGPVTPEP